MVVGPSTMKQPGGYEVSVSGYLKEAMSNMLGQTFMLDLMRKFDKIPELRDTVRPTPLEWKGHMKVKLWLRSVHNGVSYDTFALYVGGWEDLVDCIVSIELIPSGSGCL